jgi:hypothetical protein
MTQEEKIDWNKLETGGYVRLESDKEKCLLLTRWRIGTWFERLGLSFQVDEEDGTLVSKQFTITGRRLISALKPIIKKADREGREAIRVKICRTGEGFDSSYQAIELPLVEEEEVSDE